MAILAVLFRLGTAREDKGKDCHREVLQPGGEVGSLQSRERGLDALGLRTVLAIMVPF